MQSEKLYKKYSTGRHWEQHPTSYAEHFSIFLKQNNFKGQIVDIGCGNGRDVNFFSKSGFNVSGIDYDKKEILLAKNNFPSLKFEVKNIENLDFQDNSVDAFFMINVIHYVDKEKTLQEIFRVLKSKGYFFIHFNIEITDKNGNVDYQHSEKDILKSISKFKIIEKKIFEREDLKPIKHKHEIMELILQKD